MEKKSETQGQAMEFFLFSDLVCGLPRLYYPSLGGIQKLNYLPKLVCEK